MSFFCRIDAGPVGGSERMARGPVGTDGALLDPFVAWNESVACLLRVSSTSFRRFSSAIRSRSAFERNLGFAAAASFSRFAFSMSSMLGGCFLFNDAKPFFFFG